MSNEHTGGFKEKEKRALELLTEVWNVYTELLEQHSCDMEEFRISLHRCQHLVMIRPVRRMDKSFNNFENVTEKLLESMSKRSNTQSTKEE